MYTISECVACVVVAFTLSTFLCAFWVVLHTVRWGIESQRHKRTVTVLARERSGGHCGRSEV
jgi:hypothetical protein